MQSREVDDYLTGLDEPKRSTLAALRATILELLPDAEECMSYRLPAYRIDGKVVAGFAAFKNHLAYLPHSGSVFKALADDLASYEYTSGSLHFPIDQPLSLDLVAKLIDVKLAQAGLVPRNQ